MKTNKQRLKEKLLLVMSISLLLISIGLKTENAFGKENDSFAIDYEYINVKDMAKVDVSAKSVDDDIWTNIMTSLKDSNPLFTNNVEVAINDLTLEETPFPQIAPAVLEVPRQVWRLPTVMGVVSQYPHYGHAALDITSPRGSSEYIFPVANGVISGIYTDSAGALIVTVLHNVDGVNYTSLYAHLSSYADGLYVGKEVTVNDVLGRMGTTGYSTGVHLHLVVVDCALFNPNDVNCSNLGSFFNYTNTRLTQDYIGLGSHIYVPGAWNSR